MRCWFLCIVLACATFSISAYGQKKLIPASRSELTGLSLPAGAQQDKRGLSTSAAKMLFELESKKAGVGVNTPEVFVLPPLSKSQYGTDSLVKGLQALGWSFKPLESDTTYAWLQKGGKYLMAYFETGPRETSLYFAETTAVPVFAPAAGTGGNPAAPPSVTKNAGPPAGAGTVAPGVQPGHPPPGTPGADNAKPAAVVGGYAYHTTNFDDGWISTIAADKVIVTKGALRVFIYFTEAYTDASRSVDARDWGWNNIITRDFTPQTRQYRDNGQVMSVLQPPYVEGWALEKASGRKYFIALFIGSASGMMFPTLAIAPDEASLRAAFPKAAEKYESDLEKMRGANRFAVDARDLTGKWIGGDGAAMNYYDAYTGNYLGMSTVSMSQEFTFAANGTYTSTHKGASGQVGNMRVYQQEYKGKFSVDRWSLTVDNRFDGKTEDYHCYFEVVRGGRVLHLRNKQYSGLGYQLIREPSK